MEKTEILREYFGHPDFKEGQAELIDAILSGQDVLGIMPTGAGKSICYQVPALMLEGITIVISPLISLMKDQVTALVQSGVPCAYLNSSLTSEQYMRALQNAKRGAYKVIYVAPERLTTEGFLGLCSQVRVSMVTVDEAHCVSQWGQDFRPSYMRIPEFLGRLGYRPIVSAFTATATASVRDDIIRMLGLNSPFVKTTGFDRPNLFFGVMQPKNKYNALKEILDRNREKSGIVYCSTRKTVEEVCDKLCADGYACTRYHGGLSDEERIRNQDDFIYDRKTIIAATNAFGMGIDKSNVSYVVHYNMPKNIESYYQEAGRAGRDGSEAECILLYSPKDVQTNIFLIENSKDSADLDEETAELLKRRDMHRLSVMKDYCSCDDCLRAYIRRYFGENPEESCEKCSNCKGNFTEVDVTLESQKIMSCIYRLYQRHLRFGMTVVSGILAGSESEKISHFKLDTLSTYGIMKGETQVRIRGIIRHLENKGMIAVDDHSALTLTSRSAAVLRGEEKVIMRVREEKKAQKKNAVSSFDKDLFTALRAVRSELARQLRLPPYMIFSDQTLRDMSVKRPLTEEGMRSVSGIGKAKAERYGKYFIKAISDWLAENEQRGKENVAGGYSYLDTLRDTKPKSIYEAIVPRAGELHDLGASVTIRELCSEILTQLSVNARVSVLRNAVNDWLFNEGYVTKPDGKHFDTTILSEEAGISKLTKQKQSGERYTYLVIDPQGQMFIFANLDEILKGK